MFQCPVLGGGMGWLCGKYHYFQFITILMSNQTQVQLWLSWGCDNIVLTSKSKQSLSWVWDSSDTACLWRMRHVYRYCMDLICWRRPKRRCVCGILKHAARNHTYVSYWSRDTWTVKWCTRQIHFLLLHVRIVTQTKPDSCHLGAGKQGMNDVLSLGNERKVW